MTESLCQMPWGNDWGWPWLCGRERPCPDHDQPVTPGVALRLAARSMNCVDDAELLTAMAAELDTAPATVPLADHPALEWLAIHLWQRARDGDPVEEVASSLREWLADRQATGLDAAPSAPPLPTTPPAETPEPVADHCLNCNAPMVHRGGRLEHQTGDPRRCTPPDGTEAQR